jgi:transposase
MAQRQRFSAEYTREAVALLEAPGGTVRQIAVDLGIGAALLGRWRREVRQAPGHAFRGPGRAWDEELSQVRRELARVAKERDFLREAAAFFARASR